MSAEEKMNGRVDKTVKVNLLNQHFAGQNNDGEGLSGKKKREWDRELYRGGESISNILEGQ